MGNPNCEKCNGKGHYLVPNYQHDVMERIECMDCYAEEHYKWHLSEELSRVLVNASPQKLSMIISEIIVNGIDRDENNSLARIETIIQTKNINEALVLADIYGRSE
tara:strand:+ start:423 stop:740 length:318 start_codon:yes stop_codon:yes gene_type:complete